jgi:putative acetyltransferase
MPSILRTNTENKDFQSLVALLDTELAKRDGDEHAYYAQFNTIDKLHHAVVVFENENPVACGGLKYFEGNGMEVKRMFVLEPERGKGFAQLVLGALEDWARESGCKRCVLETGKRQPEAIRFYEKSGYIRIPNYGQYKGIENSICFEKQL